MKQQAFAGFKKRNDSFGGSQFANSNPKVSRPLESKMPIHLVLRARRNGMRSPLTFKAVNDIFYQTAKKHGVRMGQWVNYIILKSVDDEEKRKVERREEEENRQAFKEMIDQFPTKGLMAIIYDRLNTSIEELSKKIDRQYKPWWKFWG